MRYNKRDCARRRNESPHLSGGSIRLSSGWRHLSSVSPAFVERLSAFVERFAAFIERLSSFVERLAVFIERLAVFIERLSSFIERLSSFVERLSSFVERLAAFIERLAAFVERLAVFIERLHMFTGRHASFEGWSPANSLTYAEITTKGHSNRKRQDQRQFSKKSERRFINMRIGSDFSLANYFSEVVVEISAMLIVCMRKSQPLNFYFEVATIRKGDENVS